MNFAPEPNKVIESKKPSVEYENGFINVLNFVNRVNEFKQARTLLKATRGILIINSVFQSRPPLAYIANVARPDSTPTPPPPCSAYRPIPPPPHGLLFFKFSFNKHFL